MERHESGRKSLDSEPGKPAEPVRLIVGSSFAGNRPAIRAKGSTCANRLGRREGRESLLGRPNGTAKGSGRKIVREFWSGVDRIGLRSMRRGETTFLDATTRRTSASGIVGRGSVISESTAGCMT